MQHKMQLALISNPHTKEPKKLWNILDEQIQPEPSLRSDKLDKTAFMKLKEQLSSSRAIKVK